MEKLYYLPRMKGTNDLGIEFCAFAGAGVLGVSYAGALQALDEERVRPSIKYYAGSSAGSISALFGACNASGDFCRGLLETDIGSFLDYGGNVRESGAWGKFLSLTYGTAELFIRLGQARGDVLTKWIGDSLETLGYNRNLTFSELYNQTGNHCLITATSVTDYETIYFSRASYPDMAVREAVHASMILPYIFQPVQLNDPLAKDPRLLVDGGILDNYPINVFDLLSSQAKLTAINRKAIGFIPMYQGSWISNYQQVNGLVKFSSSLLQNIHNRLHVLQSRQPYFWERTISIEAGKVFSRDFDLSKEDKRYLYDSGYNATKNYLRKRRIMINQYGPLPDNLFIPITYGASSETDGTPENINNEAIQDTIMYSTNAKNFSFKNFC